MGVGLIYTPASERACQFIFPPNTREWTARERLHVEVPRWIERLAKYENLELTTDIDIIGPLKCPWLENYGDDLYLARGVFKSTRMREVDEDLIWASQEIAKELEIEAPADNKVFRALPDDFMSQMEHVGNNLDAVYDDLRAAKKGYDEEHAAGLI